MGQRQNGWLVVWFIAYVFAVAAAIVAVPQLSTSALPLLPWDFWWVFLVLTPHLGAAALWPSVRAGWYSRWAVGLFWVAAVILGAWLQLISFLLARMCGSVS